MDTLITFGDYTFEQRNQISVQDNFGRIKTRYRQFYGAEGRYDEYGRSTAPADLGQVRTEFWLFGNQGNLDNKRRAVRAMAAYGYEDLTMLPNGLAGARTRYCEARCVAVEMQQDAHQLAHLRQRVRVTFEVPYPFWLEDSRNQVPKWGAFKWGSGIDWGGTDPVFTLSSSANTFALSNSGNAPCKLTLQISPAISGQLINPKIERLESSIVKDSLLYTGTLTPTDTLVVNTGGYSAKVGSNDAYSKLTFLRPEHWCILEPGDNMFRLTATTFTGNAMVRGNWSNAYW